MRYLVAFLILICLAANAPAQPVDTVYGYGYLAPLKHDTLTTSPDAATWQKLTSRSEYRPYKNEIEFRNTEKEGKRLERGAGILVNIFRFFSSATGKALLLLLFISLTAYFLHRWLGRQNQSLFYSEKKFKETESEDSPEDLSQDWQAAMQGALQKTDYRLAIRFAYLYLLQILHERQWIDYHPNKTNRAYAAALSEAANRDLFLKLSRLYEKTWYGYQPAGQEEFEAFLKQFEILKSKAGA